MTREATHSSSTIELNEPSSLPPSLSGAPGEPQRPLFEGSLREKLENPFEALPAPGRGLRRNADGSLKSATGIKVGGLALLITLGATLGGVIAVHPSFNQNELPAVATVVEQPAPSIAEPAELEYRAAEAKTVSIPDAGSAPEQSNIIAYTQGLPVQLAPRQFLMAQGGTRSIPNSYISAPVDPAFHRMVEPELIETNSGIGRFSTQDDGLDWQGGFRFGDTAGNMQRGQRYSEYLDSKIGSPFTNKLSVTAQEPSKLLPKISRAK